MIQVLLSPGLKSMAMSIIWKTSITLCCCGRYACMVTTPPVSVPLSSLNLEAILLVLNKQSTAWMHLVPFSARLCLTKILPDYLMDINVDSFLSVISCKPFIHFSKSLLWEINDQREKSDPDYIPKMFAAPCFWLIWFVSSIPSLVSLLLTIMGHAIISLSIVNKANWFALLTMVCHKSCNLFLCEWM